MNTPRIRPNVSTSTTFRFNFNVNIQKPTSHITAVLNFYLIDTLIEDRIQWQKFFVHATLNFYLATCGDDPIAQLTSQMNAKQIQQKVQLADELLYKIFILKIEKYQKLYVDRNPVSFWNYIEVLIVKNRRRSIDHVCNKFSLFVKKTWQIFTWLFAVNYIPFPMLTFVLIVLENQVEMYFSRMKKSSYATNPPDSLI